MPSYNSTHTGEQIDTCIETYQNITDVQDIVAEAIRQAKLTMYPVGSIYMSISSTNPGTFIGGTWERIEDTFLLAAGQTYTAGATGGQTQVSHTHNYGVQFGGWCGETIFEADGNTGTLKYDTSNNVSLSGWGGNVIAADASVNSSVSSSSTTTHNMYHYRSTANTSYTSVSTLPPYLSVYVWKRVV